MANLGDISKINLSNGNVVNIKDATARAQANWNTNNGVKNLSPISGGTVASVGRVAKMPCNIPAGTYVMGWVSTATSGSSVITFYKNGTQIAQGGFTNSTTYSITSITLTDTANEIELYTYTANTISNVMICPKSLYDADSTYEPYALPNTKITPELIELVDSGAKNKIYKYKLSSGITISNTLIFTINSDSSFTLNGTSGSSSVGKDMAYYEGTGEMVYSVQSPLSGCDLRIYDAIAAPANELGRLDSTKSSIIINHVGKAVISLVVNANQTFNNVVVKPMVCSKAAWDVSQKYVPYRPTYEETVEQVATNKNNISSVMPTYMEVSSTDTVDNLPQGVITCAPTVSIAGIASGSWLVIHTYYLLSNGLRRLQVLEAQTGERKSRYYGITAVGQDPSWGAWS